MGDHTYYSENFFHMIYHGDMYLLFHFLVDCYFMIYSLATPIFFSFSNILEIILSITILFFHLVLHQFSMSLNALCKHNFNDYIIFQHMSLS